MSNRERVLTAMSGFFPGSSRRALLLVLAVAVVGCNYGLRGGGGFPPHVRTIFIAPLDNETVQFDIDQQIHLAMTEQLPRQLGVRLGGERTADAIVRGRVVRYEDMAQSYLPGQQPGSVNVLQHQVQVTVALQIVDVQRNEILFEGTGLVGRGEYNPDRGVAGQDDARARAIEALIQQIVDRAMAQW
jgi:hypothetical protein